MNEVKIGVDPRRLSATIEVVEGTRRHPAPAGQIPGITPHGGQTIQESQQTPSEPALTVPASPRPAAMNTYRRFIDAVRRGDHPRH